MKQFALIGAGFWAQYQLAAWQELNQARCVAVCDVDLSKARKLAERFGIEPVFDNVAKLFDNLQLDFVDIVTPPATHKSLVQQAAERGCDVICQKPLAENHDDARQMVEQCEQAEVKLLVHENFRWQHPLREVQQLLQGGEIGRPFRARIHFCSSFPVFDNQPLLAELKQFLLADLGVHILDVARFFFGDATSLYCATQRVNAAIQGEDVSTVMLQMESGVTVLNEMSYATRSKDECFPQTYVFIEGECGSIELVKDYWIHVTTKSGTESFRAPPPPYDWADPQYLVAHASMVGCHENLLAELSGTGRAETTGRDNLRTLQLVYESYRSAAENKVVQL